MATTNLVPSYDLRAEPAPAATLLSRLRRFVPVFHVTVFTLLFGVAVANCWGDGALVVFCICAYAFMVSWAIVSRCTDKLPRGSPAVAWAERALWFSVAGAFAASLYRVHYNVGW